MKQPLLIAFFAWSLVLFAVEAEAQNVGIGTTTPTQQLDVNGKLRVRGLSHTTRSQFVGVDSAGNLGLVSLTTDSVFAPATPQNLGAALTTAQPTDVIVHNAVAYVLSMGADSVLVYDCSSPSAPVLVGGVPTGNGPRRIVLHNNRLYVVNTADNTLQIFDCTNPTQLQLLGQATTATLPRGIGVSGNYVFVACGNSNVLQVFNCANPAVPLLVGSVPTDTGPLEIEMAGLWLYLINVNGNTMQIFNCSAPETPFLVSRVNIPGPNGLFVKDNLAYVVGGNGRLQVYNCTLPAAPVLAGVAATATDPRGLFLSGSTACITSFVSNKLQVFDCSIPALPVLRGEATTTANPRAVVVHNNVAYVVTEFGRRLETFQLLKSGGVLVQNPDGSTAQVSPGSFLDNLGNHTATRDLNLAGFTLTGDGGTRGLRILSNGTVQVNTTDPGAALQFPVDLRNRKIALWDGLNNDHRFLGFGVNAGQLRYQVGNTDDDHVFYAGLSETASSELMRIKGNGNVGIGTSAPAAPLQFRNRLQNRTLVLWEGGTNNQHQFHGFGVNNGRMRYQVTNPSDAHAFYAGLSADTSRELMRIVGNGNVGIGTSTPLQRLDVAGSIAINDYALWLRAGNDPFHALAYAEDIDGPRLSGFSGGALASLNGDALVWHANGNVGVGTNAPQQKLDVAGNTRIDGTLTVDSIALSPVQAPTLTGAWVNYGLGFAPAGYYKDLQGRVYLRGLIKGGTIFPGTVLFNLPVGFRPLAGRLVFTADNAGFQGRIDVLTNGDVVLMTANNNNYFNLSGISFRVD